MKKFIENVRTWLRKWNAARSERRGLRVQKAALEDSRRRIRVVDLNGALFVGIDGIALLPLSDFMLEKATIPEWLDVVRGTYIEWQVNDMLKD